MAFFRNQATYTLRYSKGFEQRTNLSDDIFRFCPGSLARISHIYLKEAIIKSLSVPCKMKWHFFW